MKPLSTFFIRIFFLAGISFAMIMLLIDLLMGYGFDLGKFLFMFVCFGGFMSVCLALIHRYRLRKKGLTRKNGDIFGVYQSMAVQSMLSPGELKAALMEDSYFGKMQLVEKSNGLQLKAGTTFWSWGEYIEIELVSSKPGFGYEYQVSSRPSVKTTIIDYGKNLENIRNLEKLLQYEA